MRNSRGTGNMELHLDRKLSEKRIFPAIDINKSGTRKEELLLTAEELDMMYLLRRAMGSLGAQEMTELVIERLRHTKNNEEFRQLVVKSPFADNVRALS